MSQAKSALEIAIDNLIAAKVSAQAVCVNITDLQSWIETLTSTLRFLVRLKVPRNVHNIFLVERTWFLFFSVMFGPVIECRALNSQ